MASFLSLTAARNVAYTPFVCVVMESPADKSAAERPTPVSVEHVRVRMTNRDRDDSAEPPRCCCGRGDSDWTGQRSGGGAARRTPGTSGNVNATALGGGGRAHSAKQRVFIQQFSFPAGK